MKDATDCSIHKCSVQDKQEENCIADIMKKKFYDKKKQQLTTAVVLVTEPVTKFTEN